MLAPNDSTEVIVERFGVLAFRLIEDEVLRAITRNDHDAVELWKAKLLEVNSLIAAVASPSPFPGTDRPGDSPAAR